MECARMKFIDLTDAMTHHSCLFSEAALRMELQNTKVSVSIKPRTNGWRKYRLIESSILLASMIMKWQLPLTKDLLYQNH